MKKIQMVDLMAQYEKIKPAIDEAIHSVIDKTQFINGPEVSAFQAELADYLEVRNVIPCANGTDALQIAMMALGLKPGDEVITPSFTYIATTEVIALLGLKPIFVEVDPLTFCLDPHAVEAAITPKTKAIVPVHLYGQAANMEPLMAIANKHQLFVIEDNAQAIGCTYYFENGDKAKTGTIGHIGCTSFFPSKNLGCFGDGGALFTNDDALANTIRMIANHGQSKRYYHDTVGCNSRLDSIQAAILRVKLRQLDIYNEARKTLAEQYDQAFANIPEVRTPVRSTYSDHVFHQYTLQMDAERRDDFQSHLEKWDIPSMIYYPVPAHRQKMFNAFGSSATSLPITDILTGKVISLPMHTEMQPDQLAHILSAIEAYF
ncbi:MAG: DegT/DnrJ/EryC1/StrS family aminotransferase [Flavobacteriales bacterium]